MTLQPGKHQAMATLPDGTKVVLAEFDTHVEAHSYINKIYLSSN